MVKSDFCVWRSHFYFLKLPLHGPYYELHKLLFEILSNIDMKLIIFKSYICLFFEPLHKCYQFMIAYIWKRLIFNQFSYLMHIIIWC